MKKEYIQPQTIDVTALLGADILEGTSVGGQSYNPVDPNPDNRGDVDWSAKENSFDSGKDLWDDDDNDW